MKIGILTYHRAHNYGAMLQAYALKQFLLNLHHEVEIIDYWPKAHQQAYAIVQWPKKNASLRKLAMDFIAYTITFIRRTIRHAKFEQFAHYYLALPHQIRYCDPTQIQYTYDLVIIGSDQIWRNYNSDHTYLGHDWVYFGSGIPNSVRCIAYAASMGILKNTSDEATSIKNYLRKFQSVMVRETSLQTYLQTLTIPSTVVCDPTLLISREQWYSLLPTNRYCNKKYVLFYELLERADLRQQAYEFANNNHCDLIILTARVHPIPHCGVKQMESPLSFLHAIRDAEYVIATSFHGTAFSIIFEKDFIVTGLGDNHTRITSLLQKVNLMDRYHENTIPSAITSINYNDIKAPKLQYIQDSTKQLQNALTCQ